MLTESSTPMSPWREGGREGRREGGRERGREGGREGVNQLHTNSTNSQHHNQCLTG